MPVHPHGMRTGSIALVTLSTLAPWTPVEARVTDPKGVSFSLHFDSFRCQLIEK